MKITAISSEHSAHDAIALVTDPPLTAEIFNEVERLNHTPTLQALNLQMTAGCLVLRSDLSTPELREALEHLLTEAENIVNGTATRTQEELQQSEKALALESAAAGFGLPIV